MKIIAAAVILMLNVPLCIADGPGNLSGKNKTEDLIGVDSRAAKSRTANDSRGWIDVLQLQQAVAKVLDLPTGDYDCSGGEGDEEETQFRSKKERISYERRRKLAELKARRYVAKCEAQRKRESKAFARALEALNKKWVPLLERAVEQNDLVAEVVLRSCGTAPLLNRTGLAADCSERREEREFARTRLEAIRFEPALYKYANTSDAISNCSSNDFIAEQRCVVEAQIARYKRILKVMRSGYFGVAESGNRCPMKSRSEDVDRLVEECQRLFYLMRAAVTMSFRAYAPELSLACPTEFPGGTDSINFRNLTRIDWAPFTDREFQTKFDRDAEQIVSEIKSNIEGDLRRDPRWGIFLLDHFGNRTYKLDAGIPVSSDDPCLRVPRN
jgi:hypothetical protein